MDNTTSMQSSSSDESENDISSSSSTLSVKSIDSYLTAISIQDVNAAAATLSNEQNCSIDNAEDLLETNTSNESDNCEAKTTNRLCQTNSMQELYAYAEKVIIGEQNNDFELENFTGIAPQVVNFGVIAEPQRSTAVVLFEESENELKKECSNLNKCSEKDEEEIVVYLVPGENAHFKRNAQKLQPMLKNLHKKIYKKKVSKQGVAQEVLKLDNSNNNQITLTDTLEEADFEEDEYEMEDLFEESEEELPLDDDASDESSEYEEEDSNNENQNNQENQENQEDREIHEVANT